MQRSFSVVEDDDGVSVEDNLEDEKTKYKDVSDLSDSEENSNSPKHLNETRRMSTKEIAKDVEDNPFQNLPTKEVISKLLSAGPARQIATRKIKARNDEKLAHMSSDSEDSEIEGKGKVALSGEYDPKLYENLDVDDEVKDIFQFILKYIPQQLNLDYKFKPFIPEFLPAVGDIDAFLKVIPPATTLTGEKFDEKDLNLGLTVLDEPASNQSDPALLHLQLRAASVNPVTKHEGNVVVKKVDNLEKNAKVIDKWIKDISDLHKSKSSPVVRYSEAMPDLDDLMQQWPEETENTLRKRGFPEPKENMSVSEYADIVCNTFQIPIAKKKVQSLHLLFCLYGAIKQTQLYKASAANNEKTNTYEASKKEADQLVLD